MKIEEITSVRLKILVIIVTPLILYWQDFLLIFNEALHSDLSSHIILLPFILWYLLYRLKKVLLVSFSWSYKDVLLFNRIALREILGVLLCTFAYIVKWYGSYTFSPLEYHIASIPVLVSGLILLLFNTQTLRILLFPVAFLFFLIPPPIDTAHQIGALLAVIGARLSFILLKIGGFPVNLNTDYGSPIIYLTKPDGVTIPFTIDLACSGLYSFIGLIIFAIFFAYVSRGSLIKKLIVFVSSFPIIYSLNVIRITTIILIGYYLGTGISLNVFHLVGGWVLIFLGSLTILVMADRFFNIRIFQGDETNCPHTIKDAEGTSCLQCGKILSVSSFPPSRMEALKFTTIIGITLLLLSVQVPVFTLTSGQSEIFSKDPFMDATLKSVLPEMQGYNLSFVYRDTNFEDISNQNASLMYRYIANDETLTNIWVLIEVGTVKSNLHRWETCLILMPEIKNKEIYTKVDLRDIHLIENPPLSARYFAYRPVDSDLTEVILYWYTQSIFQTDKGYKTLISKISVIKYASKPQYYREAEEMILPFAEAIANYWRPISTWSGIGIALAQNSPILITLITFTLLLFVIYDQYLQRERSKKVMMLYDQIIDVEDRNILDTLNTPENKAMTENDIYIKYVEATGEDIDKNILHLKLKKAEDLGIISMNLFNIDNEPFLKWKFNKYNLTSKINIMKNWLQDFNYIKL